MYVTFVLFFIYIYIYIKFKFQRNGHLKSAFTRVSRFIWKCGTQRREYHDENLMVEQCLSTLFHLAGIHRWPQGRFVDLFNRFVRSHNFTDILVQNVWMKGYLQCDHVADENYIHVDIDSNSSSYNLLLEDICSDNRLKQLSRAAHIILRHHWNLFIRLF